LLPAHQKKPSNTGSGAPGIKVVALLKGGIAVDLMSLGEESGEEEEE
jgi:hypothetical protein